jgi:hypothetical protein
MNELSIVALIVSTISLMLSSIGIAISLGIKWSTHKIEWKPLEVSNLEEEFSKFKEEEEDTSAEEALRLSRQGLSKKKKDKDPLDEILESNNF